MKKPPLDDVIEIEQLLARYAVGMTRDDIDTVLDVFTPDTVSRFGMSPEPIFFASCVPHD